MRTGQQAANIGNTQFLEAWTRVDRGLRYAAEPGGKPPTLRPNLDKVVDADDWASAFASFRPDLQPGTPCTDKASFSDDF
jgi:iron complex outermembrane receptor protein